MERPFSRVSQCCVLVGCLVGLASCGNSGGTGNAPTTPGTGGEHAGAVNCTAPKVGATPPPQAFVGLGSVTIQGKTCAVLTDGSGHTLYYDKNDTPTKLDCTDANGCTKTWRPLHILSGAPSEPWLPGKLTVWSNSPDGPVLLYNGHPLYRYIPEFDTPPGTANGEGKNGVWFIATPDLPAQS